MCIPPVCNSVEGPDCSVTGVIWRKVKSWETDGIHTDTHRYTQAHTLPHTFSTPKGTVIYCAAQMGIAAACHSHTYTHLVKQMSSKPGVVVLEANINITSTNESSSLLLRVIMVKMIRLL